MHGMNKNHDIVASFENKRWSQTQQKVEFRHKAALALLPESTRTVLDVGCGEGVFLRMVRDANPAVRTFGVDLSEKGIQRAREKDSQTTYVHTEAVYALPFDEGSFDVVTALDVLEHTLEPGLLLAEIRRVSKRYVILSVPNFSSFPARLQVLLGEVPENNRPNKGHMYWFTRNIVHALIRTHSLRVIHEYTNTVHEQTPVVGRIMSMLKAQLPQLFSLSFVVLLERTDIDSRTSGNASKTP